MIDLHPRVVQAAGHLRKILPAYLHQQRIHLHHVNLTDLFVFHKLPHHTAVSAADNQHLLHVRMHGHRHMADHFMIDKFIHLRQHQISVGHQNFPEFPGFQHIDPLILALGGEKLPFNLDGQLHILRMHIGKPHFHRQSPAFH